MAGTRPPAYAVIDLRLEDGYGLEVVAALRERRPDAKIVVLTGYGAIASAVAAVKIGATDYLAKPADTDDIEAAFGMIAGDVATPIGERQTSLKTLEWERIHAVLAETDFNISEAARRLGLHRRTLARKLEKQRVK